MTFSKGSGYSKGDLTESEAPIILYGRLYTKYETSISDVDMYVEAKEGSVYSKGGDLNIVMPNEDIIAICRGVYGQCGETLGTCEYDNYTEDISTYYSRVRK